MFLNLWNLGFQHYQVYIILNSHGFDWSLILKANLLDS